MKKLRQEEVRTLQEFIDVEKEFREKLHKSSQNDVGSDISYQIWYRGQPDEYYKLIPSLHRIPYAIRNELNIFNTYQRLYIKPPKEEWDLLFEMQHHEVPTRLLDWTETRDIALFFALRETGNSNPALFLINPFHLNNVQPNDDLIGFSKFKKNYPNYRTFLDKLKDTNEYEHPVAIKPDLHQGRMNQQRSTFTLHGGNNNPIEEQVPDCVAKIILSEKAVHELRNLIMKSWDNYRIFPDKTGLALHIRKIFYLDNPLKHITTELQKRWVKDLENIKEQVDQDYKPLFGGLQGCVLGKYSYLNVPNRFINKQFNEQKSGKKPSLVSWIKGINAIKNSQICFVLGGAGSGKTNFILNTVDTLLMEDHSNKNILWCALGQLKEGQDIIDVLTKTLQTLFVNPFDSYVNSQVVKELCRQEHSLLILDGLDEFARTHGILEAKNKIADLRRNLGKSSKLKIIIGCRDHIYETSARHWMEEYNTVAEFWLNDLKPEDVAKSLGIKGKVKADERKAFEIAASIPLFLSAAKHLEIPYSELITVTSEANFRHKILKCVIQNVDNINNENHLEVQLKKLGEVAALMIEKRRDFLSESDLWESDGVTETIERYSTRAKWPLFIQESEEEWRFVHQSIREYILAWNVFNSFKNFHDDSGFITKTSALDFESAEVYCFLADLIEEEKKSDMFEIVIDNSMSKATADPEKWNHRMRNLFEAIGMLGEVCSKETRESAIDAALDIVVDSSEKVNRPYANFTTVYNAVRCIERLHPSGSESHCRYRMILEKSKVEYFQFQGYAVRGFMRKQRSIGNTPSQAFRKDLVKLKDKSDLNIKTSNILKAALTKYLEQNELDLHQQFIATNISFALCRWLPHNKESKDWLLKHLPSADKLSKPIYSNLQLALWYRYEVTAEVCYTYSERVLTKSQFKANPFFQALVTDFTIETINKGKKLTIELPTQAKWLFSDEHRELFRKEYLKDTEKIESLQRQINSSLFSNKKERINHCFRLASGGTLPILEIEGIEYYSFSYREIEPIGWNISNGGSDNIEEIIDPNKIIKRELCEELIIVDPDNKCLYTFRSDSLNRIKRTYHQLLKDLKLSDQFNELEVKPVENLQVIKGPDTMKLTLWGEKRTAKGFYLNINAADLGIEFDQVIIVKGLNSNVRLLDGEIMNLHESDKSKLVFVNSPVGLFSKKTMDKILTDERRFFLPDVLFWGGKLVYGSFEKENTSNNNGDKIPEILYQFAKEKLENKYSEAWDRFLDCRKKGIESDLCPATRMILQRTIMNEKDNK